MGTSTSSGNGEISEYTVHPTEDFGMPTHPLSECGSGTPQENPTALRAMFSGQGSTQHQSILDFVLLNAGAALYVAGAASKFNEGVAKAREAVES